MMRRLGFICAVVIGLAIGGCGDDPEDQCKDLVEAVCSKLAECTAEASGLKESDIKSQCVEQSGKACEGAGEAKGDVDDCIDAVNETSCGDFEGDTLPDACN
jgi:hypothetical protein